MHSRMGALSESEYIYGDALRMLQELNQPARVLSVGLGVGYNELIIEGLAQTAGLHVEKIVTYEIVALLRDTFDDIIANPRTTELTIDKTKNELTELTGIEAIHYAQTAAVQVIAQKYGISPVELSQGLLSLKQNNVWEIEHEFNLCSFTGKNFNCVFFDPFSRNSQPDLWELEALDRFLSKALSPVCVFSTYAATGDLKRALQRQGFDIVRSKGFGYKRESTLAVRKGE